MKKVCGAVLVECWSSDGKPREREVRCTMPPDHAGRHGWELDKGDAATRLHVDATLVAAHRMAELQSENERLLGLLHGSRYSLAVIENLRAALSRIVAAADQGDVPDIVDGPWVDRVVDAVSDMMLKLDAHEDASTPAFDEIAKLCGAPEWEYPGQVVRDVMHVIAERDRLMVRRDELLATIVRLSNTVPFPEEWKDWEGTRAKLVAEVGSLRSQVKFLSDDQMRLIEEREGHRLQREAAQTERDELRAQLAVDSGRPQPQHSTECGTAYRGCSPHCAFALAQVEEGDDPCLVEGGRREDEAL